MPDERPNIILIVADQLRGDCLGVEGRHPVLTPRLDALAARGTRFTRAYSSSPVCVPARRSLLSGQHPSTHGLRGFADGVEWDVEHTLPGTLRDAGYQTQLVGRDMHQHPVRRRFGYEEMVVGEDYERWLERRLDVDTRHDPADPYGGPMYASGLMQNDWTARPWPHDEALHFTNWTVGEARRFLERRDPSCPFFLTMSFLAPHPPLVPPAFYFERYLRLPAPEPAIGDWAREAEASPEPDATRAELADELRRSALAGYYGLVNHLDDQLGRLFTLLNGIPGFDPAETIVVVTADHGEMLGDHRLWRKSLPYEGAARIPFLLAAPPRFGLEAGRVVDHPVGLEDVMPTLLDLAGVEIPPGIDGMSLVPLLRGDEVPPRELHLELSAGDRSTSFHALTDGRRKYIWFVESGREQLFDLEADPRELHDLAADPGAAGILDEWRARLRDRLAHRPEGFVAEGRLQPGRPYPVVAGAPR